MSSAKLGVIAVWILCGAGFLVGTDTVLAQAARWGFRLMGLAHVIEFLIFRRVLGNAPGSIAHHFFQTLIFGYFHIQEAQAATVPHDGGSS